MPVFEAAAEGVTAVSGSPAAVLSLAAAPNPARGTLQLALALPSSDPARIELFDLSGRRVAARTLAGRTGAHVVRLDETRGLDPGVYVVRLTQGREARTRRVTVLR
jgi:hypothetical protein